ncbi:MAG: hypothetical protein KBC53_07715, partial [Nitrosomonas sp.]|nr:hypothetical protein [Nitrosomonas sp.]
MTASPSVQEKLSRLGIRTELDLILHLIKSPVSKVSASGVAVLSHTPDIANARIEFANGAVA